MIAASPPEQLNTDKANLRLVQTRTRFLFHLSTSITPLVSFAEAQPSLVHSIELSRTAKQVLQGQKWGGQKSTQLGLVRGIDNFSIPQCRASGRPGRVAARRSAARAAVDRQHS